MLCGVVDEVVECLPEPRRVAVHEQARLDRCVDPRPGQPCRVDRLLRERREIESFELDRARVGVDQEALDARARRLGEPPQAHPVVGAGVCIALGDRPERRDRAAKLVREHAQLVGRHPLIEHDAQAVACPGGRVGEHGILVPQPGLDECEQLG
jgi:hypothetical protein